MATDVSAAQFRGLLIPDPRLSSVWAAESSFSQADPQPGIPASQGNYDLSLTASGSQAAAGAMRIRSQAPGHPGKSGPGGFVWRNNGDAFYRGWDVPNSISNFQSVIYTDGTGVTLSAIFPSVVCLDDQTIVCAFHRQTASAHQVRVRVMSSAANTFGSGITVYSQASAPSASFDSSSYHPHLVKLPGDRLLLYYFGALDGKGFIRAYESTDKGSTWTLAASSVLAAPIDIGTVTGAGRTDYQLRYIRAAYGGGQVLLMLAVLSNNTSFATSSRELYIQYASDSAGLRFSKVEDGPFSASPGDTPAERLSDFDLVYQASAFKICSLYSAYGDKLAIIRQASAFQAVSSAAYSETGFLNYSDLSNGQIAMSVSDDGSIYVHVMGRQKTGASPEFGCCWVSSDDGITIDDLGQQDLIPSVGTEIGPDGVWWSGGNVSYPKYLSTCFARGRVVLMCNHAANPGNEDNSLSLIALGGASTVTLPGVAGYYTNTARGTWSESWLPFDLPADTGIWTATVTGTQTLADGQLQLSTGAGQDAHYAADLTTTVYTTGYIIRASLICTSGNLGNDACSIRVRLADGADDYDVSVRFSSAGFRVYDNNGASQVGVDVALTMSTEYEFIIAMIGGSTGNNDGEIQIWYRQKNSSSDRNWVKSTAGSTLVDDPAPGAALSSNIQWGHDNQLAASKWTEFHVIRASQTGGTNITSQANPGDLWSKPYAPAGSRSYVDAGLFVTAQDGPARLADEYDIDTRYGYAIDRIFFSESQSPRVKWRSTDQTQQTIALALDNTLLGTDDSQAGNDVIALALLGVNWKDGELQGYDAGTTSWTTIATIDAADGLSSLGWVRDGNTIQPGGASAGSQYLQTAEFDGGTFGLQDGTGTDLRKITTSTAGKWSGSTVQKLPTIILEGVAASDRSSGALGYIMAPNIVVVAKLNGSKYAGYRIQIDAQSTVDGYFTMGQALLGWVSAFGRQYSRGRIIETAANSSVVTRPDGTTSSTNYGPAARNVQIAWTDGVDVSQISGSSPDPDYIKGSTDGSAEPIASPAGIPYQIEGIVRQLDGPDKAVVYLPGIAKAGNTITLNRRQQFVPGRLSSPARLESVLGDEGVSPGEVFRVATVNIQEIV
jgi:hypothetical protein